MHKAVFILLSVELVHIYQATTGTPSEDTSIFGRRNSDCRPVFTCPVQQAANFTEIATLVVKVSELSDRLRAVENANDEMNKLKGEESRNIWEVRRCDLDTESSSPDSLILDATYGTPSPEFCQAVGSIVVPGTTYEISADVYNKQGGSGFEDGRPGILFNARNSKNFDLIYFRPLSPTTCYQTGYLACGKYVHIRNGICPHGPPKGRVWFNLKVKVTKFNVSVYMNGAMVISYMPHFSARGQGGAFIWPGYNNTVMYKNFKISAKTT